MSLPVKSTLVRPLLTVKVLARVELAAAVLLLMVTREPVDAPRLLAVRLTVPPPKDEG